MIAILMAAALAQASPGLLRLEELAASLDLCATRAAHLEHDGLAWAEHDRRLVLVALIGADQAFAAAVEVPGALAADDGTDVARALDDAGRALREWSDARAALDRPWMRSAARRLREAIERAQAIVSAAEAADTAARPSS